MLLIISFIIQSVFASRAHVGTECHMTPSVFQTQLQKDKFFEKLNLAVSIKSVLYSLDKTKADKVRNPKLVSQIKEIFSQSDALELIMLCKQHSLEGTSKVYSQNCYACVDCDIDPACQLPFQKELVYERKEVIQTLNHLLKVCLRTSVGLQL